ncbi:transposase domain-containing protein, partial [Nostoc flagelliforme FACHB-838]
MAIPATVIEDAIANTKSEEERKRSLPAQLVVSLVIAMSLWSKDSMRDVLKNLIDGLSEAWIKVGKYWRVPCKSAITQARQRLGARVFGRPSSRPGTVAAFPKVRLVVLIEAGTHIIFDALMCPYRIGERVRALKLLRSVKSGMLLMWDRGLHSYAMVSSTVSQGCDY